MPSRLLSAFEGLGVCGILVAAPVLVLGQTKFTPQGTEYPIAGALRGEQMFPHMALNSAGGYLIWQDNATDGDGTGISARRLDSNLTGGFGSFRVNEQGVGDQQNPKAAMLKNGGAVFVWQGGPAGAQDIFARFVSRNGTFAGAEIRVNTIVKDQQANPVIATLANGDVIIVWSSYGQDGSMQGIFGQRFSESGEKIGSEFQVNQYASFNQRNPSVTSSGKTGFVVTWISEQRRFENSIDVYARLFDPDNGGSGNEFLVNTGTNVCANPTIKSLANGGFLVGWSEQDIGVLENGWDVAARVFHSDGSAATAAVKINVREKGDQYAPQIANLDGNNLVVWTSLGQDRFREGVFGRFVGDDLKAVSDEFQVNTYAFSQQMHPTVASDGAGLFAVVWTSFVGGERTFDLFAQRYSSSVATPSSPFVSALNSSRLSVTWPGAQANEVAGYEIYVDGSSVPIFVTGNIVSAGPFAPGSTHSFRLAYRLSDGSKSALSASVSGTTWGADDNLDGLPDDWQSSFWGTDSSKWPDGRSDSDGDGATDLQEFMAGTDPKNSQSVLRTSIVSTPRGNFLQWNAQPGFIYQVQAKNELNADWTDLGAPRFAAGTTDSLLIEGSANPAYYRVKRLR